MGSLNPGFVFYILLFDILLLKMVFSYTPKSDKCCVDHKLVVLVSVVNDLEPEDLLKTKVFIETRFLLLLIFI